MALVTAMAAGMETGTGMAAFKCAVNAAVLALGRLEASLAALSEAGIDEVYCGVRDGHFEQPHTGGVEWVKAIRECSALPVHVHLMVQRPERFLADYQAAGATSISLQVEACIHDHRALSGLREAGISAGVALMPGTPLTAVDYLLPLADRLLLRTGHPLASDASLRGKAAERVRILKEHMAYHEYRCTIEVEGGIDVESAGRYVHFGAGSLVLGGGALPLGGGGDWTQALASFKQGVDAARQLV